MRRDMDLVRALLILVEEGASGSLPEVPEVPGHEQPVILEHIRLMVDGGLLSAIDASTAGDIDYLDIALTWEGHEFIDKVRDPKIWNDTKVGAKKIGSWSFGVLGGLAEAFIKAKAQSLGLPL